MSPLKRKKLNKIRLELDKLDNSLIKIIKRRTNLVKKVLALKEKKRQIIDQKRNKVNGSVKLKLYKGNVIIESRQTKSLAYSMKKVSFEENKTFNKKKVENFIKFHSKQLNKG